MPTFYSAFRIHCVGGGNYIVLLEINLFSCCYFAEEIMNYCIYYPVNCYEHEIY